MTDGHAKVCEETLGKIESVKALLDDLAGFFKFYTSSATSTHQYLVELEAAFTKIEAERDEARALARDIWATFLPYTMLHPSENHQILDDWMNRAPWLKETE